MYILVNRGHAQISISYQFKEETRCQNISYIYFQFSQNAGTPWTANLFQVLASLLSRGPWINNLSSAHQSWLKKKKLGALVIPTPYSLQDLTWWICGFSGSLNSRNWLPEMCVRARTFDHSMHSLWSFLWTVSRGFLSMRSRLLGSLLSIRAVLGWTLLMSLSFSY